MEPEQLIKALAPITSRVRRDISAVKTLDGSRWTKDPLTVGRMKKHLNGGPARGVCPIKAGESVTMLGLLDFDSHGGETDWAGMTQAVEQVVDALRARGGEPIAFRSSGGRGVHLYLLWDEPQDAYSVRQFLADSLADVGFTNGTKGVAAGQVEIFPKQDHVPEDGNGNQFILPLAAKSVPLEPLLGYEPMGREHIIGMDWPTSQPVPFIEKPARALPAPVEIDLGTITEALKAIPNEGNDELDYDEWRNIIFAIHAVTGGNEEGRQLAHQFSALSSKYDPDFLDDRVWPYITEKEDGVGAGTILHIAKRYGWTDVTKVADIDEFDDLTISGEGDGSGDGPVDDYQPAPRLQRGGKGQSEVLATIHNVVALLGRPDLTGVWIGRDQFRDEIMFHKGDEQWQNFTDDDYTALRKQLETSMIDRPIGREMIRDAVSLVAREHAFDSAITWLSGLVWDGTPRVEQFLAGYLGARGPVEYLQAASRYLWTALAGRVLDPGCKADMTLCLVGGQGVGKTRAVKALAPAEEFFDEISFEEREGDLARRLRGKLVAEISELRGLNTRDAEHIKAFLTRTHESWVPKYREFAVSYPRRLMFLATTNADEFLADETGNRRWLPVTVGFRIDVEAIQRDCLQLWAEAAVLWSAGGVEYREAERLARHEHEDYRVTDSWEDAVEAWLETPVGFGDDLDKAKDGQGYTGREVLIGALGFEPKQIKKADEMRLARVLKALGWKKQRAFRGSKRVAEWVKEDDTPA